MQRRALVVTLLHCKGQARLRATFVLLASHDDHSTSEIETRGRKNETRCDAASLNLSQRRQHQDVPQRDSLCGLWLVCSCCLDVDTAHALRKEEGKKLGMSIGRSHGDDQEKRAIDTGALYERPKCTKEELQFRMAPMVAMVVGSSSSSSSCCYCSLS